MEVENLISSDEDSDVVVVVPSQPGLSHAAKSESQQGPSNQDAASSRTWWGFLRAPTAKDMVVKRRVQPPMEHLVVLDFEWTADNRKAMLPCSEIIQFPSVLVRLDGQKSAVVDEFNTYVRPSYNPRLTKFSMELTAIDQETVDSAPFLEDAFTKYLAWLKSHGLIDADGARIGRWASCTWSDADIGSQLAREFRQKSIVIPSCFTDWVNLKVLYKRHYRIEPEGGLQRCVERLGLKFEGRAHDGLVDSRNTAAIVLHMARGSMIYGSFTFRRPTRGLDRDGNAFGSRASRNTQNSKSRDSLGQNAGKRKLWESGESCQLRQSEFKNSRLSGPERWQA